MAVQELGGIAEIEGWDSSGQAPWYTRARRGLWSFIRKKPLGAACGFVVIFFILIGDLVPETTNKALSTPVPSPIGGFNIKPDFGKPIPYLADQLETETSFVYPYAKQDLRARFQ